jgi:phosphoribosylformylglycinamidine synthase
MASRIGVITFPGTCDDRDALRAIEVCGGEPVALWHKDDDLRGVDGVFLPGVLRANHHGRFNCLEAELVIERPSPWTGNRAAGETLTIPIKHGEGAWFVPDAEAERLADGGQVLLRYRENPNGATAGVAGVCNEAGNVFGLMPHPEHAVDALIGSTDGRFVVGGLLEIAAVPA